METLWVLNATGIIIDAAEEMLAALREYRSPAPPSSDRLGKRVDANLEK